MLLSVGMNYWCSSRNKPPYNKEDEESVQGHIVVITGSNSGIGAIAALEMAKRGAVVVMACRDVQKAENVKQDIESKVPGAILNIVELDLGNFESVRKCASSIKEKYPHVNILLNNAGVFFPDSKLHKTKDGMEAHFATNHLGHFLLTLLLLDHMKAPGGRIVFTSSSLYKLADLDLNDLMLEKRGSFGFRYWGPYNNSKLANMYCVRELAKRLSPQSGIHVYALCPGYVKTEIFRNESHVNSFITSIPLKLFGLTPEQGVETILYCAISHQCSNSTGKMYHFNSEWKSILENLSSEISEQLWEKSLVLVKLQEDELPKVLLRSSTSMATRDDATWELK